MAKVASEYEVESIFIEKLGPSTSVAPINTPPEPLVGKVYYITKLPE